MKNWLKGGLVGISVYILISIIPFYLFFTEHAIENLDAMIIPIQLILFFIFGSLISYFIYNGKFSTWLRGGLIGIVIILFLMLNRYYLFSSIDQINDFFKESFYSLMGNWNLLEPASYGYSIHFLGILGTIIGSFLIGSLIGLSLKKSVKN